MPEMLGWVPTHVAGTGAGLSINRDLGPCFLGLCGVFGAVAGGRLMLLPFCTEPAFSGAVSTELGTATGCSAPGNRCSCSAYFHTARINKGTAITQATIRASDSRPSLRTGTALGTFAVTRGLVGATFCAGTTAATEEVALGCGPGCFTSCGRAAALGAVRAISKGSAAVRIKSSSDGDSASAELPTAGVIGRVRTAISGSTTRSGLRPFVPVETGTACETDRRGSDGL